MAGQWPRVWCRSRYPGQCSYFIQVSAAGWRLDTEYGNIPLIISSHIQQNTPHSGYGASSATYPQLRSRSFSSPDLVCEFAALQSAASSLCRLETPQHSTSLHCTSVTLSNKHHVVMLEETKIVPLVQLLLRLVSLVFTRAEETRR